MGRKKLNKQSKGLPTRWAFSHGAFFYRVPPGHEHLWDGKKWFPLGKTQSEAYAEWAKRIAKPTAIHKMAELFDRYSIEVIPTKKPKTQKSNINSLKFLRAAFSEMNPAEIEPIHIYQYRDARSASSPVSANRDLELLSHTFTKAIEWGAIREHPMTGKKVVKNKTVARDRYVTDEEFSRFYYDFAGEFLQAYLLVKLCIPARKAAILNIRMSDISEDGVFLKNVKGSRPTVFSWTPELRAAIDRAKSQRKKIGSLFLFSTRLGQPYVKEDGDTSGFDSIWQRRMGAFSAAGNARFTEHDIRAAVGSEADGLERAQQLLTHASAATTNKHYRRKPDVVVPAKSSKLRGKI